MQENGSFNEQERIMRQLEALEGRFEELSIRITLPEVISDGDLFRKLMREHSEMAEMAEVAKQYRQLVDERDQAVSRKSAWLAYRIVANGCWIVSLAALVVYGISRIPAALAVTITLDAVTIGAFAALLGAEVYYEKRM